MRLFAERIKRLTGVREPMETEKRDCPYEWNIYSQGSDLCPIDVCMPCAIGKFQIPVDLALAGGELRAEPAETHLRLVAMSY